MFGNIGFPEILLILVVILFVFGAKRLPEIGASFGKGIREFKKSISEASDAVTGPEPGPPASRQLDQRSTQPPSQEGGPKRLSE
jgi:sec-independent protein translocase protein TatA